jgi:IclR family transcriptional regulator, carbohydrate utilization repressor
MNDPTATTTSIQVMSRMFSLLDALAENEQASTLKHLSAQTGLHPSTAHRILNDLAVGRFVERAGPGSYRLGLRLLDLGNKVRIRLDLKDVAVKVMLGLHRTINLPVSLYVKEDNDCVPVVKTFQDRHGINIQRMSDPRDQAINGLIGRAMLLKDSPAQIQNMCQKHGLRMESVSLDLQQVRQNGVLIGEDAFSTGRQTCCVSPIYDDTGKVAGALACTGINAAEMGPMIKQAAANISEQMGWTNVQS